jgi:hypothetical protein
MKDSLQAREARALRAQESAHFDMGALPSQPIDMSGRADLLFFGCLPRQPVVEQGTSNLIRSWSFAPP